MTDVAAAKAQARRAVRARLTSLAPERWSAASAAVCERVIALPEFEKAAVVMAYSPLPGEVDVLGVVRACGERGKRVALPRVDWESGSMVAAEVPAGGLDGLATGRFGVVEPGADAVAIDPALIGLVLVPGVAFDTRGGRLGRGKGFYDRFLAGLPAHSAGRALKVGVAIEEQIVDDVPMDKWDIRLDAVITDRRLLRVIRDDSERTA